MPYSSFFAFGACHIRFRLRVYLLRDEGFDPLRKMCQMDAKDGCPKDRQTEREKEREKEKVRERDFIASREFSAGRSLR